MPGPSKREKRLARKALQPEPVTTRPQPSLLWLGSLTQGLLAAIRLPATSYAAILLFQLKVVWGMWWYRDMSTGDTTQYYLRAFDWFQTGRTEFLWSPMYTAFWGTLMHLSSDPYVVTILHRLVIVLASSILVLALMRRLLPPGIAWMAAAWWAVLPINFDTLYEVHLFAVLPLLFGVLAVLWIPGPWGRGMSAGIQLATGILMRNEYLVAAALFAALSLGWEILRSVRGTSDFKKIGLAYGLPILAACAVSLVFFIRSSPAPSAAGLRVKQTLNVCQVFAAGYQQRAPDFQGSIWTECDQLMNRYFGSADLTFMEAFRRNPQAMLRHVLWNIQLTPSGLQVLLFNLRSGSANPDYAPTVQSNLVLIPTVAACATILAGLILLFRERERWRAEWTEQRVWAWIAMGCMALSVCAALLSNRPRPSYMFILGVALRALIAYCFYVLVSRWPTLGKAAAGISVMLVAAVLIIPSGYERNPSSRQILTAYRRVRPAAAGFAEPHSLLVTGAFGLEIATYAGRCNCKTMTFDRLRREMAPGVSLAQALDRQGANLFYADEQVLTDPEAVQFVNHAGSHQWRVVAIRHAAGENWAVLRRNP